VSRGGRGALANRPVGHIAIRLGVMVNVELVRLGYARASSYPPDVKYQEDILRAEREARAAARGLWGRDE
jgi:endonuclease YncB( thermonuclease family)